MFRIALLTIFPDLFESFLNSSLIAKALDKNLIQIDLVNIREFAAAPHYQVDDTPYGGGGGMVMKPEPLAAAVESLKTDSVSAPVILLSPSGQPFSQQKAVEFSKLQEMIVVCGRYEGIDQRFIDLYVDQEISIGDFVLMGGEVPAMAIVEATARLIPGVIGNEQSLDKESFCISEGESLLLEGPHYTRPAEFQGLTVPDELLSGDHARIEEWRKSKALIKTRAVRPDLLVKKN